MKKTLKQRLLHCCEGEVTQRPFRLNLSDDENGFSPDMCQSLVMPGYRAEAGTSEIVKVEDWNCLGDLRFQEKWVKQGSLKSIEELPVEGVSLLLLECIMCDPRFEENMTTREVCEAIIHPDTAACKTSYARWVAAHSIARIAAHPESEVDVRNLVGKANLFVSHFWGFRFKDVVLALQRFAAQSDLPAAICFVWMDCFVVNQHSLIPFLTKDSVGAFEDIVRRAGRAVVLSQSCEFAESWNRTWCLYELFVCIQRDVPIHLFFLDQISTKEFQKRMMVLDAWDQIDLRNSCTTNPKDKRAIIGIVTEEWGFKQFDTILKQYLRGWQVSQLQDPISSYNVVLQLLEKGVQPNLLSKVVWGETALHRVCRSKQPGEVKLNILRSLLRSGFDPSLRTVRLKNAEIRLDGPSSIDLIRRSKDGAVLEIFKDYLSRAQDSDDDVVAEETGTFGSNEEDDDRAGFGTRAEPSGTLTDLDPSKQSMRNLKACAPCIIL